MPTLEMVEAPVLNLFADLTFFCTSFFSGQNTDFFFSNWQLMVLHKKAPLFTSVHSTVQCSLDVQSMGFPYVTRLITVPVFFIWIITIHSVMMFTCISSFIHSFILLVQSDSLPILHRTEVHREARVGEGRGWNWHSWYQQLCSGRLLFIHH